MLDLFANAPPDLVRVIGGFVFVIFFLARRRRRARMAGPQTIIALD
jgi:hypothetical protein